MPVRYSCVSMVEIGDEVHFSFFIFQHPSTTANHYTNQTPITPIRIHINNMRTIYSPYRAQQAPTNPSSHPVKKERESLSSQTLDTCPTWGSSDSDSLKLEHTFSHDSEANIENNDPVQVAPKSTTKERKRWIEDTLLKKEYTPYNTPAREEYCRNRSQHDLTAERKKWIESTLLSKEQKAYNTKTREEYCKNKDNHELTNERKRWIEETLLTKTNTLPQTPPNKKLKLDDSADMKQEESTTEIVDEAPVRRQFSQPSEIDAELMSKLQKRKQAEDGAEVKPAEDNHALEEAKQKQVLASHPFKFDAELMRKLQKRKQAEDGAEVEQSVDDHTQEEAKQKQVMAEEGARQCQRKADEARQRHLVAKEEARKRQSKIEEARRASLMEEEARQLQRMAEQEAKQRQLIAAEEARQQLQLMKEEEERQRELNKEEARRMEQERITEEAKLAEEAIAALQQRLDEERLKREELEKEAKLANEARNEEHKRFVELAENAKLFETRIVELERQAQQRSKMRAYISTLREEKKLREDELAIVEELEKDIEDEEEDKDGDDDDGEFAAEYQRYLSNYRSMSEHISTMGSNNIFAMSPHPNKGDEMSPTNSDVSNILCPGVETAFARAQIGVQSDVPRRTPLVIRSAGSFTDLEEMKNTAVTKKHKKRMKLLEKLVKLLGRSKTYEC